MSVLLSAGALAGMAAGVLAVVALPDHDDGAHGGDGATALLVVALTVGWAVVLGGAALACSLVAQSKATRSPVPVQRLVPWSMGLALVPFGLLVAALAVAFVADALEGA